MNQTSNSRRSFLSSIALLSAGAAIGSVPGWLQNETGANEPDRLWKTFCLQNDGSPIDANESLKELALPPVAKGHSVQLGRPVSFNVPGLIAIPAFIHWNKKAASDLVITVFEKGTSNKKILRINRYELEALCTDNMGITLPGLVANAKNKGESSTQKMAIKTRIKKGKEAEILVS